MELSTQSRIAVFLYSLFAALLLCSIPLYAADETGYTFRSSTNEVRLAFAASDRQGHVVKTLHSSDIAVADNGSIIRHFRSFRPASESPLDLVILLDTSDSVTKQLPAEIAEVKAFIADSIWGERDRISIVAFGGLQPQLICTRNCNSQIAQVKLTTLKVNGSTPLYDALFQSSQILTTNHDPEARSAMILFSDGSDTISLHGGSDALQAAQNIQAAIYSVNSRSMKSAPSDGDAVLDCLASSTGGLSFVPGQNVKELLRVVVNDLHSGYVLTYDLPSQTSGQHSVQILPMSDPRLQFRSRRAYNDATDE